MLARDAIVPNPRVFLRPKEAIMGNAIRRGNDYSDRGSGNVLVWIVGVVVAVVLLSYIVSAFKGAPQETAHAIELAQSREETNAAREDAKKAKAELEKVKTEV